MSEPLSPAAAAIVQALYDRYEQALDDRYEISKFNEDWQGKCLAAALRALVVRINGANAIRQDILDIAAELEAQ